MSGAALVASYRIIFTYRVGLSEHVTGVRSRHVAEGDGSLLQWIEFFAAVLLIG